MKIVLLILVLIMFGCDKTEKLSDEELKEYLYFFHEVNTSNDRDKIISGIEYIDSLIENGMEKDIHSLYYNKAQLLYKLGDYKDAIETLKKDKAQELNLAALYIILDDEKEAKDVLDILYQRYKTYLKKERDKEKRNDIVQMLAYISILSDKNIDEIWENLIKEGILSRQEQERMSIYIPAREELLKGIWGNEVGLPSPR